MPLKVTEGVTTGLKPVEQYFSVMLFMLTG